MAWDRPIHGGLVFLLPVTQLNSSAWLPVALVTVGQTCSSFNPLQSHPHETEAWLWFSGGVSLLEGIFFLSLGHQIAPCCRFALYRKCKINAIAELASQRRLVFL